MKSLAPTRSGEEGFLLITLVVMAALILITLAVAAPRVAKELQRERELEAVNRGQQYVRAIQLYYRKLGSYPTSIDQLVKSNDVRFLRRRYVDPITGKDDWRIIHLGEAKTQVTGFFGQPLAGGMLNIGTPASAISSMPGATSGGSPMDGSPGSSLGSPMGGSGTSLFGGQTDTTSSSGSATTGANTAATGTGSPAASGSSDSTTGTSATSFGGSSAPIVGVSVNSPKQSIIAIHKKTVYNQWEFLYDPRVEQQQMSNSLAGGSDATQQPGIGMGAGTGTGMGTGTGSGFSLGSPTTGTGGSGSTSPTTGSNPQNQ
jgi:type II secretory pathway pseudopilin PulG